MAEHYAEGQYDDDLTIGLDDVSEEAYFEEDDLLKYQSSEDESPLARLKSLVLSIDWEITDEVLRQFNEELIHLREICDGEKIYLVYIQALGTVSKYIYQKKTNAHPNAIKILPVLYNNLEKVMHDEELSDKDRQQILLADVSRFNELKEQIGGVSAKENVDKVLRKVKAIVLSIDWEITKTDLEQLGVEVVKLEVAFKENKPCTIMLQGIGTLAAYIQHKAGNAHPDAFVLVHDFYLALEKLILSKLPAEQEKKILFAEVEKFNAFKKVIASTISPEALKRDSAGRFDVKAELQATEHVDYGTVQPAFADVAPDKTSGFQEEQEAENVEQEVDISARLDSFFADAPDEVEEVVSLQSEEVEPDIDVDESGSVAMEAESRLGDFFDDNTSEDSGKIDKATALRGVDVETEADDDSDEEALPVLGGELAPALADNDAQSSFSEDALANGEKEWEKPIDGFMGDSSDLPLEKKDTEVVIDEDSSIGFIAEVKGVDVETEADDDSDEVPLPLGGDAPAPALVAFDAEDEEEGGNDDSEFDDQLGIDSTLDAFFGEDENVTGEESAPEEVDLLKEYFDEDFDEPADEIAGKTDGAIATITRDVVTEEQTVENSIDGSIDDFFGVGEEHTEVVISEDVIAEKTTLEETVEEQSVFEEETGNIVPKDTDENKISDAIVPTAVGVIATSMSTDDDVGKGSEDSIGVIPSSATDQKTIGIDEEDLVEFIEVTEDTPETTLFEALDDDPYEDLRVCVQSLGIEINDQIIDGLMSEINQMRQKMVAEPLGKSFLQLMSTVTQHISHYRYSSGAGAYELLIAALDGMEKGLAVVGAEGQEIFLAEMYKVLNWQQSIMEQQAVGGVEKFESSTDVSDQSSLEKEFFNEGEDELLYAVLEEEMAEEAEENSNEVGVEEIRYELQSLRQTLQEEIAQLRAELTK